MFRFFDFSTLSVFRLMVPFLLVLSFQGCAIMKTLSMPSPSRTIPEEKIARNNFSVEKEEDVIGRLVYMTLEKGDTLPDIARHFSLGINEISAANPGVDLWAPEKGQKIMLPLSFILPEQPRKGVVINLAAMRLFQFKGESGSPAVSTYPVGVGSTEKPSPIGQMTVQRKTYRPTWHVPASIAEAHRKKGDPLPAMVPPGPLNPLGEYALYLSRSTYLIHGTNKPASIGLNATNGCIRMYPEDIKRLYAGTAVKTPVRIINQPYLIGRRDGVVYLEAHSPLENTDPAELDKTFLKLIRLEKKSSRKLDWKKIKGVVTEARGIPVSISEAGKDSEAFFVESIEVTHPVKLYGKPEVPEMRDDAWYVLAGDKPDRTDAVRLSAMINHQGPQIPARVISGKDSFRVIAGPFNEGGDAREAAKRMKIDLEIDGVLIEPSARK